MFTLRLLWSLQCSGLQFCTLFAASFLYSVPCVCSLHCPLFACTLFVAVLFFTLLSASFSVQYSMLLFCTLFGPVLLLYSVRSFSFFQLNAVIFLQLLRCSSVLCSVLFFLRSELLCSEFGLVDSVFIVPGEILICNLSDSVLFCILFETVLFCNLFYAVLFSILFGTVLFCILFDAVLFCFMFDANFSSFLFFVLLCFVFCSM